MRRAVVLLALLVCRPALAQTCGGFETLALQARPLQLLGGRLTVRALAGSELKARPGSIMGADPSAVAESRVWLEKKGGKKLVISARELFSRPVKDLAAVAQGRLPGTRVEPFSAGPLGGIALVPAKLEPGGQDRDAIHVLTVLVSSPDDTMQSLDFYVSAEVGKDLAGCPALARKIAQTLAVGDRKLEAPAGRRDLGDGVSLDLEAGQVLTVDHGPDFDVYRVQTLVPFGKVATLGVYLGHHPGMHAEPAATRVPATIFGQTVQLQERVEKGVTGRQAVVPVPGKDGLVAHVFFYADDAATLAALQRVAESLRTR